ncbi:hypothetical protein A2125_01900 [Candidatus Woesebacteria bacterium GWB1_43_5]|uniref:Uncharacterized protein n=1 Tax=Candidatus Woesebacteria bacterium GWB1_43_5 TaxID=1802474 RepID=A0A1F7WTT1_9BACT|nr:MAG: hypothetical protein A2125_01900 [Candidatus Woesebacteria bacterium GWB1_43_5]
MKSINIKNIPIALKQVKSSAPIFNVPDTPLTATAQEHLPIADITGDIVVYKDGGAAIVMESTSLNFGLLSEKEQQAVIAAYAALINSLSFSIQIVVRSERKDIRSYMNYLTGFAQKITNPKLASLMGAYRQFILDTVKKKNVLGKRFFIVIPFSPLELGIAKSALALTRRKGPLSYPKSYVVKRAKVSLYPRRDHLIRQAKRLGIALIQLSTDELIKLYYHIYNPEKPAVKQV